MAVWAFSFGPSSSLRRRRFCATPRLRTGDAHASFAVGRRRNRDRRPLGGEQLTRHRLIILGQVSLSFYAVTSAVVHEVLERLGHSVEVRQGPHEEILARMDLGLDGVTEMDWLVNVEKKTPREAARTWMKANDTRVAGWLKV
jgi:hypothetical protein